MRGFLVVFCLLLALALPGSASAAEKDRATIQSEIASTLPSSPGAVTAANLRARLVDLSDSALILGEVNTRTSTSTTYTATLLTDIAINGAAVASWTPSGDSGDVVTNFMRQTIVDTTSGDITGVGHAVGGFDHLWIKGGGSVAQSYVHEARTDIDNGTSVTLLEDYKPVLNLTGGSTVTTHRAFKCMDSDPATYSYCFYNPDSDALVESRGRIIAPSGQEIGPSPGPAYRTGRYYLPENGGASKSASSMIGDGYELATLFRVRERTTFTKIGVEVTTAGAGTVIRLGIRQDSGSGVPGTLILDAGTVDAASTGIVTATISQPLDAGDYWLTATNQGANVASIQWIDVAGSGDLYGSDTSLNIHSVVFTTGVSGALPASYGTPTFGGSGYTPLIFMGL